jgi:hypothetical protein
VLQGLDTAVAVALVKDWTIVFENGRFFQLFPPDGGDVTQQNTASSKATAGNLNLTEQDADQTQGGGSCKCGHGEQVIGQKAESDQDAAGDGGNGAGTPNGKRVSC